MCIKRLHLELVIYMLYIHVIYIYILEGTAPYGRLLLAPAEGWWASATWRALQALWIAVKKKYPHFFIGPPPLYPSPLPLPPPLKKKKKKKKNIFFLGGPAYAAAPPTPCTEVFFLLFFFFFFRPS